jgi:RNA polymerase sigma-70 factor (ECF subfamily)
MSQEIEHQLLLAAQTGDMDACEMLLLRLDPDIRRFVRRLINHVETEDDIVQEVMIAFYQNLQRINPVDTLRPYLFRIARNRCYDELRRSGRADNMSLDDEPVELHISYTEAHKQPAPDDLTHWLMLGMEVREALDRLPEVQRQTLLLYSEEGMSYAEIADIMEVSIGTVKSRLYYAKKNLRGYLRPETLDVLDDEFGMPAKVERKKSLPDATDEKSLVLSIED